MLSLERQLSSIFKISTPFYNLVTPQVYSENTQVVTKQFQMSVILSLEGYGQVTDYHNETRGTGNL